MIALRSSCSKLKKSVEGIDDHATPAEYLEHIRQLTKARKEIKEHEFECKLCNSQFFIRGVIK